MILTGVHNPADKKIPTLRNIVKMSMVSKMKTQGNKILCHWFSLIQTIWQHTWMTVNCGLSGERPSKPACVRCVWIPIGMVTLWSGRWKWLWKNQLISHHGLRTKFAFENAMNLKRFSGYHERCSWVKFTQHQLKRKWKQNEIKQTLSQIKKNEIRNDEKKYKENKSTKNLNLWKEKTI